MAFLSERTLTSSRPCPALGVHKVGKLGKLGSRWQARHDFSASPIDFTARPVSLKPPQKPDGPHEPKCTHALQNNRPHCLTLLCNTLVGHSCLTLLWDIQHLHQTTLPTPIPLSQRRRLRISRNAAPAQQKLSSTLQHVTFPCYILHMNLTLQASIQNLFQKLPALSRPYRSHSAACG